MNATKKILTGVLAFCAAHAVHADKMLAHSKSLGMSFTAVGENWCAETVNMQVQADDAGNYSLPDYGVTLQKLGQVLERECPQVSNLAITGLAAGSAVWSGTALRENGWIAQQTAVETAAPAVASPPPAAPAVPVSRQPVAAAPAVPVPVASPPGKTDDDAMVMAGWKPGGFVVVAHDAGKMTEISSRETGCNIFTFMDVKPELGPSYVAKGGLGCRNGYTHTTGEGQQSTELFYQGQQQRFARLSGNWFDGYNLVHYVPKQIVSRYRLVSKDRQNRTTSAEKLLVWVGEDRGLRAHYFTTYSYNSHQHQWRPDGTPFIVLTDNELLKANPENTRLGESLSAMYQDFTGYREHQIRDVHFVITDKMHQMPDHAYQAALAQADPDPSFYKAGRAVRQQGMPWIIEISTDFIAKREAFIEAERQRAEMERQREEARAEAERQREIARLEAEQQRAEMERQREEARVEMERQREIAKQEAERQRAEAERQRLAALRSQQQETINRQYRQLVSASEYERLRFFATLAFDSKRIEASKIDFKSARTHTPSPFSQAVTFSHPAQFIAQLQDGQGGAGSPMYMLINAKKGHVVQPYPMAVEYNETPEKINGWMLVKASGKFSFSFDKKGNPVFGITIQEAFPCKSEKCLKDADANSMMKTWYDDPDMTFAMADR